MVTQTTGQIEVKVNPLYVPEDSDPSQGYYFFAYTVRIKNSGVVPAQLMSRHWVITDAVGRVEEVRGPGVVGLQPIIMPGQEFEYSSFWALSTPTGSMRGTYQIILDDGTSLDVEIPQFYLIEPNSYH